MLRYKVLVHLCVAPHDSQVVATNFDRAAIAMVHPLFR